MFWVLFLDNTVFILNLYVQSMGYYFQNILQLSFHTDAFDQLGPSAGSTDRGRLIPEGFMNDWTLFYWIAWCPFVGNFIAKISVGRTVKEFIGGVIGAPVIYVFMWFIIFGGAGMRMEREAAQNNLCCHNIDMDTVMNLAMAEPFNIVSKEDSICIDGKCNPYSSFILGKLLEDNMTYSPWKEEITILS